MDIKRERKDSYVYFFNYRHFHTFNDFIYPDIHLRTLILI